MNSCKSLVRVKDKAQVTIPIAIRRKLWIREGSFFKVEVADGKIVLTPQILINKKVVLSKDGERK